MNANVTPRACYQALHKTTEALLSAAREGRFEELTERQQAYQRAFNRVAAIDTALGEADKQFEGKDELIRDVLAMNSELTRLIKEARTSLDKDTAGQQRTDKARLAYLSQSS
ncbi:flagellar protein FliT [Larsenimonas suaedae]|uniref:Flagellar protein FliT n=1 Tax=Larsenimonas suaedae TaxID=1851019 RepID=A0ABU1GZ41_9GAMM|nr:flagellar protein FliT [Larsenimonas suaedae]MCM2971551.1 flagellar protein FliT [Larsenimonas suaedae]MDR5896807.1 flagellar protein FliT [Larsenimonas suaedae]